MLSITLSRSSWFSKNLEYCKVNFNLVNLSLWMCLVSHLINYLKTWLGAFSICIAWLVWLNCITHCCFSNCSFTYLLAKVAVEGQRIWEGSSGRRIPMKEATFAQLLEGQQGITFSCHCWLRWEKEGISWHAGFSPTKVKSLGCFLKCSTAYEHMTYLENGYYE